MARTDVERVLEQIGLDRLRVLTPWVVIGMVTSLLLSEASNIPLTPAVFAFNVVVITALGGLAVALRMRRVPDRWCHPVTAATWAVPVSSTLIAQYFNHSPLLVLVLMLEIACTAVQLHTGWLVASFLAADAVFVPLSVRDAGANAGVYIATVCGAQVFATLMQVLMRRSLVRAETHRLAQVATAAELASQLAELKRSELERTRLHEQLLHSQRMEAVGTLAAGLAHDMNNVLAAITGFSGLLLDECDDPVMRPDIEQIHAEAQRGAELTRGLLAFSRRGQYRKQRLPIAGVVEQVMPLLARTLPKSIVVQQELTANDPWLEGDPTQLGQVLVNLCLNAADAMSGRGTLVIATVTLELDESRAAVLGIAAGRYVELRVTDTGIGMDDATRSRVFEPFFTTKPMGKGSGLGLAVVWGSIQAHGGAVTVESAPGRGSTFRIFLPVVAAQPVAAAPAPTAQPSRRTGTVLVIDDEQAVRESTTRLLERLGFTVLAAKDGVDGLRLFDQHAESIRLVILDMGMPMMSGAECFDRLRERSAVPVLVATGYAVDHDVQRLIARGAGLLEKPYTTAHLSRELDRALGTVQVVACA